MLNLRFLYWLVTAFVLAVIVHISTLLIAPGFAFERNLNALANQLPANQFVVLPRDVQARVFPEYPSGTVFGLCRFDISAGNVALNATLPDTLWTLTVYSSSGKTLYTVNDEQSGTDTFTLQFDNAPSFLDILAEPPETASLDLSGWRVSSADPQGFALFWIPTADVAMRARHAEILSKSSCKGAAA
jgi:uncharacterized membrane protein